MVLGLAAQAGGIPLAFGLAAAVGLAGCGWILGLSRVDRSRRVASAESYEMVAGSHDIAP